MKKLFPFLIITIVFIVSTACAMSVPASTPAPASTETPTLPTEPYAIVSSDKAEFWFPLPNKKEWEWAFQAGINGENYGWSVRFGNPQDYAKLDISCYYPKLSPHQTGSFEDMLKTCLKSVKLSSAREGTSADGFFTSSYSNGGLLIQMTDPSWIQKLIKDKHQSIIYQIAQTTKIMPSKTSPSSTSSYAVILPDQAQFWFQLPNQTEWTWNRPLITVGNHGDVWIPEYEWNVYFGSYTIAAGPGETDKKKPAQTGSFEDLLKTSDHPAGLNATESIAYTPLTASYANGGLLLQATDPKLLKLLNENISQPMFFQTLETFDITPVYK